MTETRTIKTDLLARVEGEGAMFLRIRDGRVDDVRLRIYEPPRFFEAFLRGRGYREPVDITARICGICPIAYQMSACAAIEDACGVEVRARDPRRCGGSSTAASGSRATRCTCSCSTRPTCSATTARSRWRATIAASSSRACRSRRPATR